MSPKEPKRSKSKTLKRKNTKEDKLRRALEKAFASFDQDGSGFIDTEELGGVLWAANQRLETSKFKFKFPRARNLEIIGLVLGCIEASKQASRFFQANTHLAASPRSSLQTDPNSNEYLLAKFGFDTAKNEPYYFVRSSSREFEFEL